jgi:hypothetical protein
MLGLLLILISKFWGCPPGLGMPFLDNYTCTPGGRDYLFLPGFSSLDDVKKLHNDHDVLYYM